MPAFDLVIFDCDGVLVDSEPLAMRVLLDAIEQEGISIDPAAAFRDYLGRSLASISASLTDSHGTPLGEASLEKMRGDLYALYRRELRANTGVRETLQALGIPFCIASSSQLERIRLSLEVTDLLPLVKDAHIFSATMVDRGKPAPDLFLHAARAMGVRPERSLVIEDSPAGIAAAQAAGMAVVAYLGGSHIAPSGLAPTIADLNPDAIIADMGHLQPLLAGWGRAVIGVDVGTTSARAAVFSLAGKTLGRADRPIATRQIDVLAAEHNSEDIWSAVSVSVRAAVEASGVDPTSIAGISFDATCSLVLRDIDGFPLAVSADGDPGWDTFCWHDHRALGEAEACTATGHRVLDYAGGVISPEMEIPKLMWLKRHRPEAWAQLGYAFDLADFLSWKATGSTARSQSTLTSKWNFLAHEGAGWPVDFLDRVGLGDLLDRCALPQRPIPVGSAIGPLTPESAATLGLSQACIVGAGMIDAHAGALGLLGAYASRPEAIAHHAALIAGTSNSILVMSDTPRPLPGIWGPYFGAIFPGLWLSEGGQSAAGSLLDHLIRWYLRAEPSAELHARIGARIRELQQAEGPDLAPDLHVLPDFHGNRSPLAEPRARGLILGLTLDASFDALCRLYWRTSVALGMGLRQILEQYGAFVEGDLSVGVAGGHTQNGVLMEAYAGATGNDLAWSPRTDMVLLGSAMSAATASGLFSSLGLAATIMHLPSANRVVEAEVMPGRERDYRVMLDLQNQRSRLPVG